MLKKITLLLVLVSLTSMGQKKKKRWSDGFVEAPKKTIPMEELKPFVQQDEELVTYSASDYNRDGLVDAVLVVAKKEEQKIFRETGEKSKRKLIILQRDFNGTLKEVFKNDKVIYCYACNTEFGNPLVAINLKSNALTIEHEAGKANRWTRIITFHYDTDMRQWFLYRDATSIYKISGSNNIQSIERFEKDFGVVPFEDFHFDMHK